MKLLVIEPSSFSDLSTFIIAVLGFLTSIGSLLLTYMMAKTAIEALSTWRNQEDHKFYMEAFEILEASFSFLDTINQRRHQLILTYEEKTILSEIKNKGLANLYLDVRSISSFLKIKDELISNVQKISNKSIALLPNDNPIRVFYTLLNEKINVFKQNETLLDMTIDTLLREDLIMQGKVVDSQNVSERDRTLAIDITVNSVIRIINDFYQETILDDHKIALSKYRETYSIRNPILGQN